MRNYRILVATLMTVMSLPMFAQSEFGIWTDASVEKKLTKRWSVEGGLGFRLRNDLQNVDRWSLNLSTDYKLTNWLKASAGYSYLYDYHPERCTYQDDGDLNKRTMTYYGSRHRFNVSLTASHWFGNVGVSLRERWQYTYRPAQDSLRMDYQHQSKGYAYPVKGKGKNVWRQRLQLKLKTGSAFTPYVSAESFVSDDGLDKMRYAAGAEIKLSKKHSLDVGYRFQKVNGTDDDTDTDRHVLSVGYTYKL